MYKLHRESSVKIPDVYDNESRIIICLRLLLELRTMYIVVINHIHLLLRGCKINKEITLQYSGKF